MTGTDAGIIIQPRDRRLLQELGIMRIIDREQAKLVAGFGSTTRANTRLHTLTEAGLLNRYFVGTIGAGRKAIYTLTAKGATAVNSPYEGLRRRRDRTLVGDLFVEHQTAINSIFILLKYKSADPNIQLRRWESFHEPPAASIPLVPDAYFELAHDSGVSAGFLEVDLGTEALKVWQQKAQGYLRLAITGEFEKRFSQPRFRVLVVTSSERRMNNIRSLIARLTDKIFWFATFEAINRDGFWSPVWLRPRGDQRQSLR